MAQSLLFLKKNYFIMKKILFLFITLTTHFTFSQSNTEVYVFDIAPAYEGLELLNARNISNNEGYDNQPSFISNETLVFAGNNDGQTDISEYNLTSKLQRWVNQKTEGGEYSPQKFPSNDDVAAVRLDKDGLQRLYHCDRLRIGQHNRPSGQILDVDFSGNRGLRALVAASSCFCGGNGSQRRRQDK